MKRSKWIFFIWIAIGLMIQFSLPSSVGSKTGIAPRKSDRGDRWRIGYYQGGEYIDYQKTLLATINGLMELGWIRKAQLDPLKTLSTKQTWQWLSTQAESDYIQFVRDAHYSADWNTETRKEKTDHIINRLTRIRDIDLMIAMGTWAGQDLTTSSHHVPTLVMSATDPLAAGIIKSPNDSGLDYVHAHIDPNRSKRQVELFYQIVQFKKLGVIYEDSVAGRSYAVIDVLEKLADRRGFEIIRCFAQSDIPDAQIAGKKYLHCFEKLSCTADAIYVSAHGGVTTHSLPGLADVAIKRRIPTFSQSGSEEVKYGLLMSLSPNSHRHVGLFEAAVMAKVLNGAKPRKLTQIFEEPSLLAINLKTAELIGFYENLTLSVLASSDEFYREIARSE